MEDLCKIYREDLWRIYGGFMTDLWRIYGQVFRILIFEFRMTPKTIENQWKTWIPKKNHRNTKENQWTKTMTLKYNKWTTI